MTTILPRASSSCTRNGRTSMMRASTCRSLVMMPDWLPVKLMASPPSSRIASDRSAIEIRSPADSSMSSSRRSGFGDTVFAMVKSSSVVSPIAETTTTTWCPWRTVRITRSATYRSFPTSATLLPPYFWTMIAMTREYDGPELIATGAADARMGNGGRTPPLLSSALDDSSQIAVVYRHRRCPVRGCVAGARAGAGARARPVRGESRPCHAQYRHRPAHQGDARGGRARAPLQHRLSRRAHDPRERADRTAARDPRRFVAADAGLGDAAGARRVHRQRQRQPALHRPASWLRAKSARL